MSGCGFPLTRSKYMPDNSTPIIGGARIGHVHLKAAELKRSRACYRNLPGFEQPAHWKCIPEHPFSANLSESLPTNR